MRRVLGVIAVVGLIVVGVRFLRQPAVTTAMAMNACETESTTGETTTLSAPAPSAVATPPATAPAPAAALYMPDGQLRSHRIRIYAPTTIVLSDRPTLTLLRSHSATVRAPGEEAPRPPTLVAPGQEWTESTDGQAHREQGTLLLFDLGNEPFGFRPMVRARPVLQWTTDGARQCAVGTSEVNVGDIGLISLWTLGVVAVAVVAVMLLGISGHGKPAEFFTGVDGHLSLAQTQIACWTIVVGGVVLGYGILRIDIPEIPGSLLVLMGTSLATGGVAYFKDAERHQTAVAAGVVAAPVQRQWAWGDLVRTFAPGEAPVLSLAKGQMVFWTIVLLVLFVSKSVLDGAIWEVPWPLVALMGFSQADYLAPKLAGQ